MLEYIPYLLIGATILVFIIYMVMKDATFSKKLKNLSSSKAAQPQHNNKEAEGQEEPKKITYGPIYLFFGSQTGTAANFCKILAEEATNNLFQPIIVDLQDFNPETFVQPKTTIVCVASHGEGEPTDNAVAFYKWLSSEEREPGILKDIKFSVFGLGNKQYQFYNAMGKKTNALLDKLGGQRIYRYGEGDDDGSLEDDFNEWKADLWKELKEKIKPYETDKSKETEEQLDFNVRFTEEDVKEDEFGPYNTETEEKEYEFQAKTFLECKDVKITKAYELRQNNDEGSTLHLEFDVRGSGLRYSTAANLYVFPENDPKLVEEISERIGAKLEQIFTLEENKGNNTHTKFKHPIPSPLSVKTYLTRFCDLQGPLKKNTLKSLAGLVKNEDKKQKYSHISSMNNNIELKRLLRLSTAAGKDEYETEIAKPMKGLYDIIIEYDISLNLKELIALADTIKPRYFTIASSAKENPDSIHICASLVEFRVDGKWRSGLVSGYFKRILEHFSKNPEFYMKARVNVKDSTFSLPTDSNRPLVLVGPGAGIAPFMGFFREKEFLIQKGENKQYGEITLYFGCRKSYSDYIYKEELEKFHRAGIINKYYAAFSREGDQRCYVQDIMMKNSDEIAKTLFEQNGSLYICGSIRMGNDVINTLSQIATDHFKVSLADGTIRIKELEQERRIIKELWE